MAVSRSRSATQIKRTISGSLLSNGLHQNQHFKRKWLARCGLGVALVLIMVYLGFYLQALHAAIHSANKSKKSMIPLSKNSAASRLRKAKAAHNVAAGVAEIKMMSVAEKQKRAAAKRASSGTVTKETLVVTTRVGDLRIVLRPDLSKESVDYVKQVVASHTCKRCTLYRAEKPGILQGIIKHESIPIPTQKGSCPAGFEKVSNDCPAWDKQCNCHGPIMTRGMVGWAAGVTGPDFFIDDYLKPAKFWGTQHTVWGELQDEASFKVLDVVWTLPSHAQGGLTMLDEPLKFEMAIES